MKLYQDSGEIFIPDGRPVENALAQTTHMGIGAHQDDLEIIKTTVDPDKIETVWTGEDKTTDIIYDIRIPGLLDLNDSVNKIKNTLQQRGIIFKP